jgi:L-amino acid N-acyltransferase YncA
VIAIREAQPSDVEKIVEMGRSFLLTGPYKDQLDNPEQATKLALSMMQDGSGHVLVSEEDGEVTGVFAFLVYPHYFTGQLTSMELIWYVSPEARKGGTALKLLAEAERIARNCGVKRMQLTAPTEEVGRLYRFCGGYKQIEVSYERAL